MLSMSECVLLHLMCIKIPFESVRSLSPPQGMQSKQKCGWPSLSDDEELVEETDTAQS